jgi:hypothetical protein
VAGLSICRLMSDAERGQERRDARAAHSHTCLELVITIGAFSTASGRVSVRVSTEVLLAGTIILTQSRPHKASRSGFTCAAPFSVVRTITRYEFFLRSRKIGRFLGDLVHRFCQYLSVIFFRSRSCHAHRSERAGTWLSYGRARFAKKHREYIYHRVRSFALMSNDRESSSLLCSYLS